MSNAKRRILMTGGTGTIGNRLLPILLESGWLVTLLARSAPAIKHPALTWTEHDLSHARSLRGMAREHDVIFHMANLSKEDPDLDFRVTDALIEEALSHEVRHFFYVSSIRVYGAQQGFLDERSIPRPIRGDTYAESKLRIEGLLASRLRDSNSQYRILRVGHVVSEETRDKVPSRLSKKYLWMWGRTYPHYIHANDVASAMGFLLAAREELKHRIYNLTREEGSRLTFNDLYLSNEPVWAQKLVRLLSLPLMASYLAYRKRRECRAQGWMRVIEKNLRDEGWSYTTDRHNIERAVRLGNSRLEAPNKLHP